jgi:small subunit ribosomal protein S12
MPTQSQLLRNPRQKTKKKTKTPALLFCPQKKGICIKVLTKTPKKPNSALRKVVKVALSNKQKIFAHVPGETHNLQEFSVVLIRGARIRDLPGVRYRVIRGLFDCASVSSRTKGRSKFGVQKTKKLFS